MITMKKNNSKIKRFTIMGERCSGTNYIQKLFLKNVFNADITWNYGWKHWFGFYDFKNDEYENETLFIGIIRDPIEWINSLYANKHHIPTENYDIDNFLFNKWYSIDNEGNEINYENTIYRDINYITNKNFKNIFELRKLKNEYLKSILPNKVHNYVLINYDNFMLHPEKNFNALCDYFSLSYEKIENIELNCYDNATLFRKRELIISKHYIDKIKENLDLEQEESLGFIYNI